MPCDWRPTSCPSRPSSFPGIAWSKDMKSQKVRDLDDLELRRQLAEMEEQLFRLHFQMSMGQMDGLKKVRSMRKVRARIFTVLRERELRSEERRVGKECRSL